MRMIFQIILPNAVKCKGAPIDEFLNFNHLLEPRQQEEEDQALENSLTASLLST